MDRLHTLVLSRAHQVVLDPDRVASAATRPLRDADVDRFEADLARAGFVMSLDLAVLVRRLPNTVLHELRGWMLATLAHAPPRASEPRCPWCGRPAEVGALDPCGHRVCRSCWEEARFAACPICHRRVAQHAASAPRALAVVHLAFDLEGATRAWIAPLLASPAPLAADARAALEAAIDHAGPRAAAWLPADIPVRETMAIAIARLWLVAPDRAGIARETAAHLRTATDVLRVASVLMGAGPDLAPPRHLRSLPRALRRAILEALDRLPAEHVDDEIARRRTLWQRVGERLHPGEHAIRLPHAARAFAIARGSMHVTRWAAPVEHALAAGDALAALAHLAGRPAELLARGRHLERVARAQSPEAVAALEAMRDELLARAAARRLVPRAVLDRALPPRHWELAALHAAARANVVYVRERDGAIRVFRRRDGEPDRTRLARLVRGPDDGRVTAIPAAEAPTLVCVVTPEPPVPATCAIAPTEDELGRDLGRAHGDATR